MLHSEYVIGIILIAAGVILKLFPPKHINSCYGYKTPFSMKNKTIWDEGNRFSAIMLVYIGAASLIVAVLCDVIYMGDFDKAFKISTTISIIALICSIIYTEIHLRILFDKNGNRRI
ncbi:SdpI family protein [Clostridium sp. P21]|uniref:SdpI family protein n=1 Tax=Clostridium muellerianum TaxID=2716538 RepID=A0A7Y0HQ52_9CLOT|nr:SdpI family protein [Clostridium muellerianum]NMM63751.1 SdpI family protein [Clostridium muellerianum]